MQDDDLKWPDNGLTFPWTVSTQLYILPNPKQDQTFLFSNRHSNFQVQMHAILSTHNLRHLESRLDANHFSDFQSKQTTIWGSGSVWALVRIIRINLNFVTYSYLVAFIFLFQNFNFASKFLDLNLWVNCNRFGSLSFRCCTFIPWRILKIFNYFIFPMIYECTEVGIGPTGHTFRWWKFIGLQRMLVTPPKKNKAFSKIPIKLW